MKRHLLTTAFVFSMILAFPPAARGETLTVNQEMFLVAQSRFGANSPEMALSLMDLARMSKEQGHYQQAVRFYRQSGEMTEKIAGPDEPFLLIVFDGLGATYEAMKKYAAADAVYQEVRDRGYAGWADQMEARADLRRAA